MEHLTDKLEREAEQILREIDALGGAVAAVEAGYFQRALEESAWQFQKEVEEGKRVIVGVNRFFDPNSPLNEPVPVQRIDPELHERRKRELAAFKANRDGESVRVGLERLREAARGEENLFPYVLEAFRRRATLGEVCGVLREEWGEYQPPGEEGHGRRSRALELLERHLRSIYEGDWATYEATTHEELSSTSGS